MAKYIKCKCGKVLNTQKPAVMKAHDCNHGGVFKKKPKECNQKQYDRFIGDVSKYFNNGG